MQSLLSQPSSLRSEDSLESQGVKEQASVATVLHSLKDAKCPAEAFGWCQFKAWQEEWASVPKACPLGCQTELCC